MTNKKEQTTKKLISGWTKADIEKLFWLMKTHDLDDQSFITRTAVREKFQRDFRRVTREQQKAAQL